MARRRTQRYKLEVEFLLADRADYSAIRDTIRRFFSGLEQQLRLQVSYTSIESCDKEQTNATVFRTPPSP